MSTPKYKVIYFNFMWLAEPTRLLLSYVKEDFEDVRLDWDEWEKPDSKITNKDDYPYRKLPALEDTENELILGQSFTIARYLGRKYKLVGKTEVEAAKCDEYADVLKDMLKEIEVMDDKDEKTKSVMKTNFLEKTVPRYFSVVESNLKKNGGKFLVGNSITWIDFLLAQMAQNFSNYLETDVIAKYPTIKGHQQQIFEIPEIKAWIAKRPATQY